MRTQAPDRPALVQLPDGRALAYALAGPGDGRPVFLFHGEPGSRLFLPDEGAAWRAGVRVVTLDRPGYGRSDAQTGRTLLDWPRDVGFVAERLGIARFSVVGISGGGPHALACAYALEGRIDGAAVVGSPCPFDFFRATDNLAPTLLEEFALGREAPHLLRPLVERAVRQIRQQPLDYLASQADRLHRVDQAVLAGPSVQALYRDDLREAVRCGGQGWLQEAHLLASPWPFALSGIAPKVVIWHGERDRVAPARMARLLWRALPNAELHMAQDEGHYLFFRHFEAILASVLPGAPSPSPPGSWRVLHRPPGPGHGAAPRLEAGDEQSDAEGDRTLDGADDRHLETAREPVARRDQRLERAHREVGRE